MIRYRTLVCVLSFGALATVALLAISSAADSNAAVALYSSYVMALIGLAGALAGKSGIEHVATSRKSPEDPHA